MNVPNELFQFIEQRDYKKIKKCCKKKNATYLLQYDVNGYHPLNAAIKLNDLQIVEMLLDFYALTKTDVNTVDKGGFSPLHCAVTCSDDAILLKLLDVKGIDVNHANKDNNTPLHYFCSQFSSPECHDAFAKMVEMGVDVNRKNNNKETPLHKAIFNHSVRVILVNMLLKNGADVNATNSLGETALHYSVRLGREDLVSILLKSGADISIRGKKEKATAYELAVEEDMKSMINLLKKYVDVWQWLDDLKMLQYVSSFCANEVFMDDIMHLNDELLDQLGVTPSGHRVKMLKASKEYKEEHVSRKKSDEESWRSLEIPSRKKSDRKSSSALSLHRDLARLTVVEDLRSSSDFQIDVAELPPELLELKQLLKSGNINSWIIQHRDLEYTDQLGAGASGKVYKGLYKGNEVAVKVLKGMADEDQREEFKKEFQIMCAIQAPQFVNFYGACLSPKVCIIMELCERGSLHGILNDPNIQIGWNRFLDWAKQIVTGMKVLHNWDPPIVHRDLKSLNILVNKRWQLKLCDFGLSRFNTESNMETLAKMKGTLAYCSPQVYFGEHFTSKSDIYSGAMILWEIVNKAITGEYERPFGEYRHLKFDFQVVVQAAKQGLRPTIPPSCPTSVKELITSMWEHEEAKRPNCESVLETIQKLKDEYAANSSDWHKALLRNAKP